MNSKLYYRKENGFMRIVNLTEETKKDLLDSLLKRSPNNYDTYTVAVNEIVIMCVHMEIRHFMIIH